jgi:proteic killer suppression protein
MIHSFADKDTEDLYRYNTVVRYRGFERVALRKLIQLAKAENLNDLRLPPGNRLERLQGDRYRQWSIRINGQWRLCFEWRDDGPHRVEIVDYH